LVGAAAELGNGDRLAMGEVQSTHSMTTHAYVTGPSILPNGVCPAQELVQRPVVDPGLEQSPRRLIRRHAIARQSTERRWARRVSNLRPLACEARPRAFRFGPAARRARIQFEADSTAASPLELDNGWRRWLRA
jgi:hypothetical protein